MNTPQHDQPGSCGKPLSHLQIQLAEDGELWVRGNSALGYIGEPLTDEWLARVIWRHSMSRDFFVS